MRNLKRRRRRKQQQQQKQQKKQKKKKKQQQKTTETHEPRHDKSHNMSVRPAKTQISLDIRPVWSESSLCAQLEAKEPSFLHADSEDSLPGAHSFCWFCRFMAHTESGSIRPLSRSPLSRSPSFPFATSRFAPGSFRPLSVRPWVVSPTFPFAPESFRPLIKFYFYY